MWGRHGVDHRARRDHLIAEDSYECAPVQLAIAGRGRVDKRGVATLKVLCRGGDPRGGGCAGLTIKLGATCGGKRAGRGRAVPLATRRFSISAPSGPVGRVGTVRLALGKTGRHLLARSKRRELRVRAQVVLGTATAKRRMLLTSKKAPKGKSKQRRKRRAKG